VTERILFLICHGRSGFSATDFTPTARGEQFDPPLDATGREQADLLARRLLSMEPPAAIYCSPLRRTLETIAPFADTRGAEVRIEDDLMEAHVGAWEGKTFEEILGSDDEILLRIRNQRPIWDRAPGVEPLAPFRERVGRAIDTALEEHAEGDVWVVCHGGVINAVVGPILGIEHEMFFLPENTSLNSVVVDGAARRVRFLNDVLHLTDPQLFD